MSKDFTIYFQIVDLQSSSFSASAIKSQRRLNLFGEIWNTESSRTENKAISLHLIEGDYASAIRERDEMLRQWNRSTAQHSDWTEISPAAIGALTITANAEPTGDHPEPFEAAVFLERADYDATIRLFEENSRDGRQTGGSIEARASSLRDAAFGHRLKDIDLTNGLQAKVMSFSVSRTIRRLVRRDSLPVRVPDRPPNEKDLEVTIVIERVGVRHSMPSGYLDSFSCDAKIGYCSARSMVGYKCDITFSEYQTSSADYPSQEMSGLFDVHHKERDTFLTLHYRRQDLTGPLAALVQMSATQGATLTIRVRHDPTKTNPATENWDGKVGYWSLSTWREFTKLSK